MQDRQTPCRCPWVDPTKQDYVDYHDKEWGVPLHDDRRLFEFLTLESAQAGLSWYTVLRKRAAYRLAFDDFDPEKVARYDAARVTGLLSNPGIIRNRQKVLPPSITPSGLLRSRRRSAASQSMSGSLWRADQK